MKGVYRDVSHWRRLLPRERDVLTGRRIGLRDDKRRDEQQSQQSQQSGDGGAGHGLLGTGVSVGTAALVAGAVVATLAVGGLGARAVLVDDDGGATVGSGGSGGSSPGGVTPGADATVSGGAGAPTPAPSEPPATAIALEYAGGSFVRHECSDASGEGECAYFAEPPTVSVYCTADGCTAYHYGTGSIDGPLRLSGTTDAETEGCQQTSWSLDLRPEGVAVTEGLGHPARIVGTVTQSRPAEVLADGTSCLGAFDEYRYDATPS